jgi:hypothetical protein
MKKIFLFGLISCFSLTIFASQVVNTGRILEISEKNVRKKLFKNTPINSFATLVANKKFSYKWTPSQMTNRILGGADILDAQLSADKSLLVIAERIGGVNKPNSTRFIMINTFNGEIVNYFTIESRLISKISFTNDRYVKLAAIQQKQEELDNPSPDAILIIDLEKRKISNEFVLPEKVTSIAYYKNNEDKEIIYYTLKDKSYFYIFDVELKTTEKEILSKIESPKLVCSKDGNILLYGRNLLELYTNTGKPIKDIKPTGYFNPDICVPLSNDFSTILFIVPNKAPQLWYGDSLQDLPVKATGQTAFDSTNNKLYLAIQPFNAITSFNLPNLEPAKPVTIGKLKPVDKSEIKFVFLLNSSKLLIIDHRGNINTVITNKRRWQKTKIFSVEK